MCISGFWGGVRVAVFCLLLFVFVFVCFFVFGLCLAPTVACVSVLSILAYHFGFFWRLFIWLIKGERSDRNSFVVWIKCTYARCIYLDSRCELYSLPCRGVLIQHYLLSKCGWSVTDILLTVALIPQNSLNMSFNKYLLIWGCMVFNATFNTNSVISWRSVLLVEKTTDLSQLYQIMFIEYASPWAVFELTTYWCMRDYDVNRNLQHILLWERKKMSVICKKYKNIL